MRRSSLHTPTAGLMMKALWLWASSSILCTTLRKVNVQPSMGSSLCGLNLMFKISFVWIQNENKSEVVFEDTWPDAQDWSRPAQVRTLQGDAGRSPAGQPQMEPVCLEMIHSMSWKKQNLAKAERLTESPQETPMKTTRFFPSQAWSQTRSLVKCISVPLKPKLQRSHWKVTKPWPPSAWACPVWHRLQELLGRTEALWGNRDMHGGFNH